MGSHSHVLACHGPLLRSPYSEFGLVAISGFMVGVHLPSSQRLYSWHNKASVCTLGAHNLLSGDYIAVIPQIPEINNLKPVSIT